MGCLKVLKILYWKRLLTTTPEKPETLAEAKRYIKHPTTWETGGGAM